MKKRPKLSKLFIQEYGKHKEQQKVKKEKGKTHSALEQVKQKEEEGVDKNEKEQFGKKRTRHILHLIIL